MHKIMRKCDGFGHKTQKNNLRIGKFVYITF